MDGSENRQLERDSLFVMAELRVDGMAGEDRVRVRNLSAGGLMAECALPVQRGQVVWVKLRNLGWVRWYGRRKRSRRPKPRNGLVPCSGAAPMCMPLKPML